MKQLKKKKRRKRKGKGIDMSNNFYVGYYEDHYLAHHGILGQKWGVRRYQNPDGSLTNAGKARYKAESVEQINTKEGYQKRLNDIDKATARNRRAYTEANAKANDQIRRKGFNIKAQRLTSKASKYDALINKGSIESEGLKAKAKSEGFDVTEKKTKRIVTTKKDMAVALAKSAAFSAVATAIAMPVADRYIVAGYVPIKRILGTRYKVDFDVDEAKKKIADYDKSHQEYNKKVEKMIGNKPNEHERDLAYAKLQSNKEFRSLSDDDFTKGIEALKLDKNVKRYSKKK